MADLIIWNSFCRPWEFSNSIVAPISVVRPVGPHQLASWLSHFGYNVKVIDFSAGMTTQQLIDITEKFIDKDTVAIGASTTFWNDGTPVDYSEPSWALNARSTIEQRYPNIEWILGGPNVINPQYHLGIYRKKWRKFIGLAEDSLLKYMDEKTSKTITRRSFDIKLLDKHFVDQNGITKHEVLPMELARGCQFKCSFCRWGMIGKKKGTYIRSAESIEQELLMNFERFGTTRYYFIEDTVNESIEKMETLAEIASRLPFKLEWVGYNRLDLVWSRPNNIELMQQTGLRSAYFGIESFHPKASMSVGKGWNGKYAKDFLLELKDRWEGKITWQTSMIVGLPKEDEQSIDSSQRWFIDNKMPSWLWSGLEISKNPDISHPSEFDREYEKFGYMFPNKSDDNYWVNQHWNRKTALDKAMQLNVELREYDKVNTWAMGELASVGYEFDDLIHLLKKDVDTAEFERRSREKIDNYVKYQLNL